MKTIFNPTFFPFPVSFTIERTLMGVQSLSHWLICNAVFCITVLLNTGYGPNQVYEGNNKLVYMILCEIQELKR